MKQEAPYIILAKSSAGSGKTHNLALRFLQTLLKSAKRINNIIAITFTNKAAIEMKQRIIKWMKMAILNLNMDNIDKPVLESLQEPLSFTNLDNEQITFSPLEGMNKIQIQKDIKEYFEHILKYYNDFKISTIDSFMTFLLRALAYSLKLPPDFEITMNTEEYFDITLNEIYDEIIEKKEVQKIFDEFINYILIAKNKVQWLPEKNIRQYVNALWESELKEGVEIIQQNITIDEVKAQYEKFKNLSRELKNDIDANSKLKVKELLKKALEKIANSTLDNPVFSKWLNKEWKTGNDGILNKGSVMPNEQIIEKYSQLRNIMKKIVEERAKLKINSVAKIYNLFKNRINKISKKDNRILINQLNAKLKNKLKEENILPELYYYLSERYDHFLIDEFQDTSLLQWKNIENITEEAFSKGGTLFLVGDEKQSIYRWRGGEYKIIENIQEKYRQNGYPSVNNLFLLDLNTNYRSDEAIVDFVNNTFKKEKLLEFIKNNLKELLSEDELDNLININKELIIYDNIKQNVLENKKGKGYVYAKKLPIIEDEKDKYEKINLKEELKKILIGILEKYEFKDIAILTRKNEQIQEIVQYLLEFKNKSETDESYAKFKNLKVESKITISLLAHPVITDIVNFLKFLKTPVENINFFSFITSQTFSKISGLNLSNIFNWVNELLLKERNAILYLEFKKWQKDIWDEYIEYFFKRVAYMPLYEFVQLLFHKWNLFKIFSDDIAYFSRFMELILNIGSESKDGLIDFIEYWDKASSQKEQEISKEFLLPTIENQNAIKVMTIHSAKGLEFPIVILPFLDFSNNKGDNTFTEKVNDKLQMYYIKKDDTKFSEKLLQIYTTEKIRAKIDELNNFYVGATRAKNGLYLFFPEKSNKGKYLQGLIFSGDADEYSSGEFSSPEKKLEESRIQEDIKEFTDLTVSDLQWHNLLKLKVKNISEISLRKYEAANIGEAMHYLLSMIKFLPDNKLEDKIATAEKKYDIVPNGFKDKIYSFLNNDKFKKFFMPEETCQIFNELEVVSKDGNKRRIDRTMIYQNKIEIIDYKTGEEYTDTHTKQILEYKNILSDIYPDKEIYCYLIYIEEENLTKV